MNHTHTPFPRIEHGEYVIRPESGVVHIIEDASPYRTLCGFKVYRSWEHGDETVSGIAATCPTCRSVFTGQGGRPVMIEAADDVTFVDVIAIPELIEELNRAQR